MRQLFFFLSISFLFSCNSQLKTEKHVTSVNSLSLAIQGDWGGFDGPTWAFGPDSVFYYSENKSYYYFIHHNDAIVLYKNGPFKLKNIRILNDTLFCGVDGINVKFFRQKNNKSSKQNSDYGKKHEISTDTTELKKSILGEWGYKYSKGIFSWRFTTDSINYIQMNKTFFYKQIENNIIVLTDEEPALMKDIIIKGDTMYFTAQDSILIKAHKIH